VLSVFDVSSQGVVSFPLKPSFTEKNADGGRRTRHHCCKHLNSTSSERLSPITISWPIRSRTGNKKPKNKNNKKNKKRNDSFQLDQSSQSFHLSCLHSVQILSSNMNPCTGRSENILTRILSHLGLELLWLSRR